MRASQRHASDAETPFRALAFHLLDPSGHLRDRPTQSSRFDHSAFIRGLHGGLLTSLGVGQQRSSFAHVPRLNDDMARPWDRRITTWLPSTFVIRWRGFIDTVPMRSTSQASFLHAVVVYPLIFLPLVAVHPRPKTTNKTVVSNRRGAVVSLVFHSGKFQGSGGRSLSGDATRWTLWGEKSCACDVSRATRAFAAS